MKRSKYKGFTDSELVGMCLAGDEQAWTALIMRYKRLIYSIPLKFNLVSEAPDIFQVVCLRLIERLHELKDESKLSSWLTTTTVRQCLHFREMRLRETSSDSDEEYFPEPTAPGGNVEEVKIQTQGEQDVREAVEQLPDRCRLLVELLYFKDRASTYDEISQIMNVPVSSIGPTRARCLEKLRTVLRWKGIQSV